MVPGIRFTALKSGVVIRCKPTLNAQPVSQIEEGFEIIAAEVFIEEGIEWVRLSKGAKATRVNGTRKQLHLNLKDDGFVATHDPLKGLLLRKHVDVVVQEKKEEGVLTKAEINEILEQCSDPGMLLPLESKYWSKQQFEMFVMSGGTIRPRWCSVPDERLMANTNMSTEDIMHALTQAADWISNADAILIGSGAGMGVDSGLGTFRGGQKGVWKGLEEVGLAYEEICQPKWFEEEPHLGWAFWDYCHSAYQATVPHEGYMAMQEWSQRCPLGYFSFTSNIDSHWIVSGISPDRVLEVHGAVRWLQCSKACCPDVWKAPKDLGLQEDEDTHRVRGILPTCPKCKAVARPNVQMFGGDKGFSKARRASQFSRYDAWLKKLESRPDKDILRITCIEVGCGLTVPTVRKELEAVVRRFPGARLIRVNPENPGISQEMASQGVSLPLRAGAAIQEISKQVVNDADMVSFILWGEEGGAEIQAPYGACLGRLLRIAQMEDGIQVQFSRTTTARKWGYGIFVDDDRGLVDLDRPIPVSAFSEVKAAEGSTFKATAVLWVAAKFKSSTNEWGLNPLLAKRVEKVKHLLDDINAVFSETKYQEDVRKCTDRRGIIKMAKNVHMQVLPNHGIAATDKGTVFMASYIASAQHFWDVQAKVDLSMDLSFVKHMSRLPAVEGSAKKKLQQQQQEQKLPPQLQEQPAAEAAAAPESQEPQPLEVKVSSMPSGDRDLGADTLTFSMTTHTTVGELRQRLREALSWDEEGAKSTKFMTKLPKGTYGALNDAEAVKRVVYVHSGPGLRAPEPIQVTFTEMSTGSDSVPQTFNLTVMTDDSVSSLRCKLGGALGWDSKTQRRVKFIIKFGSGSFGTLKEHEKVHQRKIIFVHGASLVPEQAAPSPVACRDVAPDPQPAAAQEAKKKPPAASSAAPPAPAQRPSAEQQPQPGSKSRHSKLIWVTLTILGTQDDPKPDRMRIKMRSDVTVAELRRKVQDELKLTPSMSMAVKFISKSGNNFGTMLDSKKVKEQIFVRGVSTLQPKPESEAIPFQEKELEKMREKAEKPPLAKKTLVEQIDVTVVLDRKMNFRVPVKITKDNTVWQLKEVMAATDPTGRIRPQTFSLAAYQHDSRGAVLSDSHVLGQSCVLELVAGDEEQPQPPPQPQQQLQVQPQVSSISPVPPTLALAPAPAEALVVIFTRLTTLEDPKPQCFEVSCTTATKVSEMRIRVAEVCKLDDRAAKRVKLLFRVTGGNGFMTAKESETVAREMLVHNIDRWPGQ